MTGELRELPLQGWTVSLLYLDFAFGLLFEAPDDQRTARVRISTAFDFVTATGERHHIDPGPPQTSVAPALALHTQAVVSAAVSAEGRLEISFADSSGIEVAPDKSYEAWMMTGLDANPMIVCVPGGGLAEWGPRPGGET